MSEKKLLAQLEVLLLDAEVELDEVLGQEEWLPPFFFLIIERPGQVLAQHQVTVQRVAEIRPQVVMLEADDSGPLLWHPGPTSALGAGTLDAALVLFFIWCWIFFDLLDFFVDLLPLLLRRHQDQAQIIFNNKKIEINELIKQRMIKTRTLLESEVDLNQKLFQLNFTVETAEIR